MPKACGAEFESRQFALTPAPFRLVLKADGVADPEDVDERITPDEEPRALPKERDLSRTVARHMDGPQASRQRQRLAIGDVLVNAERLHALLLIEDHAKHDLSDQAGRWRHMPKRTARLGQRHVSRVHIGPRARCSNQGWSASDVIGMAMGEDEVLEIRRFAAEGLDGIQHGSFLVGEARVDEDEFGASVEEDRVRVAHLNDVGTVDDLAERHACTFGARCPVRLTQTTVVGTVYHRPRVGQAPASKALIAVVQDCRDPVRKAIGRAAPRSDGSRAPDVVVLAIATRRSTASPTTPVERVEPPGLPADRHGGSSAGAQARSRHGFVRALAEALPKP